MDGCLYVRQRKENNGEGAKKQQKNQEKVRRNSPQVTVGNFF